MPITREPRVHFHLYSKAARRAIALVLSSAFFSSVGCGDFRPYAQVNLLSPGASAKETTLQNGAFIRFMNLTAEQKRSEKLEARKREYELHERSGAEKFAQASGDESTADEREREDDKGVEGDTRENSPYALLKPRPGADPCAYVPAVRDGAAEAEWIAALEVLGVCFRELMQPALLIRSAMTYHVHFTRKSETENLLAMEDKELAEFLKNESVSSSAIAGLDDSVEPRRKRLRNSFNDRDLSVAEALAKRLSHRLSWVEARYFEVVDAHRPLITHFAESSSRYRLLLLLRQAQRTQMKPKKLMGEVLKLLFGDRSPPSILRYFPADVLRPWSIIGVLPDQGSEADDLHDPGELPFVVGMKALAEMGGSSELIAKQRKLYTDARLADNPKMPSSNMPLHEDAVRVAILDSGVDFLKYPEIGKYLSNGQAHTMGSRDYQDDDANPYIADDGGRDGHGSWVAASLLRILDEAANDVLSERKIDLAMWKVNTIRDRLAEPYEDFASWRSREAVAEALIREASNPFPSTQPKIVSISWLFSIYKFLENVDVVEWKHHQARGMQRKDFEKISKKRAVINAPWLWVLSAGQENTSSDKAIPYCLGDVPADKRVDSRILCVGALKRSYPAKIASNSLSSDRVDLYAYESYVDVCPDGASCSTPAVAGAAAAVAARYPRFSPEEIRKILLEASDQRTVEVDSKSESGLSEAPLASNFMPGLDASAVELFPWKAKEAEGAVTRTVRFLDPITMMPKIMEVAREHFERNVFSGRK